MNLYQYYTNPQELNGYENRLTIVPTLAYLHAVNIGKPFPEGEQAIARDAMVAEAYAESILKGPFPLGEKAISVSARWSYFYARNVLKGPFQLGEKAIATHDYYSYMYAFNILKGRFKLGEPVLLPSGYGYRYTRFLNREGIYI